MRGIGFLRRRRLGRYNPDRADRNTFWRRRALAAGVVTAVIAVPLWLLLVREEGGGQGANPPPLKPNVQDRKLGIEAATPPDWKEFRPPDGLRLQSPDKSAQVVITSLPGKGKEKLAQQTALDAFQRTYKRARVRPASEKRIGGQRFRGVTVTAVNKEDVPITIVSLAGSGRKRTYLVQTFTAQRAPPGRLVEVEQVIQSLRLTG